ncbi:putative RNA polymerase II subunit B1 CTD phosphatase RPAP2 homolog [Amaranthus tricolor]|uniref:putative RNA polymerase II subunit B1 CTD phosphatase RPAP2 homolog n=1 Tax=Amaranthus tricolor TaxID=29722 RepID=UPI00258EA8E5|nr:putative RNA polymerase II subunit B1 CTD phosphatase RPAP2 homolog [Amaranthus tricolor]XP_057539739.1 putative RNA polymerase II subunit B1 CTD phosphatase RPAP2 homolog [Amaranthus tricolor]
MENNTSQAVHKLQLALLDGIEDDTMLFAAGSLMSRSDYIDVVTERSIANLCGYPLCPNLLPKHPRKGQYRISIKEHKVYDLHETYSYCCTSCLINSKAFAGSLNEERCLALTPGKIKEVLGLFENVCLGKEDEAESEELGLLKLIIKENDEIRGGVVSIEEWIGPSNSIEGYVPQRDCQSKSLSNSSIKGFEPENAKPNVQTDSVPNEIDFKVTVMSSEDTTRSTKVSELDKSSQLNSEATEPFLSDKNFRSVIIPNDKLTAHKKSEAGSNSVHSQPKKGSNRKKCSSKKGSDSFFGHADFMSTIITQDEYSVSKLPSIQVVDPNQISQEFSEKLDLVDAKRQLNCSVEPVCYSQNGPEKSTDTRIGNSADQINSLSKVPLHRSYNDASSSSKHEKDESHTVKLVPSVQLKGKSSLRTSGARKAARSVTWADEKPYGNAGGNLCEFKDFENTKEGPSTSRSKDAAGDDDLQRFASAEACAMALIQAAEAVASGQSDAYDAVSEAGIMVLPQADEGECSAKDDVVEDLAPEKWPKKPGDLSSDIFDNDSSWFECPPEGFSLTLSPFALMWNALLSWLTSYSVAYIYGKDESFHEEYIFVNGREYPGKVVLPDGRSPEIKRTLAGCLGRALPGLITDLNLPTPVSSIEHELSCLLDTMSFMDALPPFRMKQWQVIVLLFINALSVCRIPGLTAHLTNRRILIPKILNGAQISAEEYEIMKDLTIPLGRVPQFSMQSGG